LKVIHRLQAFSNAIRRIFVQHFTRFQLTVCSHGSSALAKLLVIWATALYSSPSQLPPNSENSFVGRRCKQRM